MHIEIASPTIGQTDAHTEIAPQRLGQRFMHIEIASPTIGQTDVHTEIGPQRLGRSLLVTTFLSPSPYGQSAGRLQGVGGRGEATTVTPE